MCFAFLTLGLLCFAAIHFPGDNWDRPNICRPWASNYWRARIRSIQVLFTSDVSRVQDVIVILDLSKRVSFEIVRFQWNNSTLSILFPPAMQHKMQTLPRRQLLLLR